MKLSRESTITKLVAIALILTISACASKKKSEDDEASDAKSSTRSSVSTTGTDEGGVNTVTGRDNAAASISEAEQIKLVKQTEFFFGYDSFRVSSADERAVLAHGKFLAKTPAARVRVEGHTDERGTREYNLALGERRANSVQKLLISAGAKSNQIEVVTFGEERPRASGSTEAAYSQNRRVDIQYTVGRP